MKYIIEITQDEHAESPREWESIGTMLCKHRNYNLGDKKGLSAESLLTNILDDCNVKYAKNSSIEQLMDRVLNIPKTKGVALPVSIYDHSGISMSVGIKRGWDDSHVGFIYINKETMDKNNLKYENAIKLLEQEVEVYSDYLEGNVYSFSIEKIDVTGETIEEESICGFYGSDFKENGILDSLKEYIQEEEVLKELEERISNIDIGEKIELKTSNHDNFQHDFEI